MVALFEKEIIQPMPICKNLVITSLQVLTVIFTLKVENAPKLPRFTIFPEKCMEGMACNLHADVC